MTKRETKVSDLRLVVNFHALSPLMLLQTAKKTT